MTGSELECSPSSTEYPAVEVPSRQNLAYSVSFAHSLILTSLKFISLKLHTKIQTFCLGKGFWQRRRGPQVPPVA